MKLSKLNLMNIKLKAFALFFTLSFFTNSIISQNWQWAKGAGSISAENITAICTDPSGNVYVGGTFGGTLTVIGTYTLLNANPGLSDMFLAKYDPNGNVIWAKGYGGIYNESISGITLGPSGTNIYVSGSFSSPSLVLDSYTLNDAFPGAGVNNYDAFVFEANIFGTTQWAQSAGGTGMQISTGCAYAPSTTELFVTGYFNSTNMVANTTTITNSSAAGTQDIFLLRYSQVGVVQVGKALGGINANDFATGLNVDASSNAIISGYFSTVSGSVTVIGTNTLTTLGGQDAFVAQLNSVGVPNWVKQISGTSSEGAASVKVDGGNNVFITGDVYSPTVSFGTQSLTVTGGGAFYAAKYNSTGVLQWVKGVSGASGNGKSITADPAGNAFLLARFSNSVAVVGTTTVTNVGAVGNDEVLVVKFDPLGNVVWATANGGPNYETPNVITSDMGGNLYLGGYFQIGNGVFGTTTLTNFGSFDIWLAKIGCTSAFISGPTSICAGSSGTLNVTGAVTYTWNTGANTSSIVITPTVSGIYTVTASNASCTVVSYPYSVTVLPSALNVGANLNLLCKQKQVINATCTPTSPTSVVWTPTVGLNNATVLTPTVSGGSPTQYTVTVNLNNGCVQTQTLNVSSYAQTPDICMVTVDSLGFNNEIYWEKTSYPQADSFIVYREVSLNTYKRIAGVSRTSFSMYTDTNRSIGPANGNPNLTYYKYKIQIKDSCGNLSPMSKWHETIFIQDQMNGNFNWNPYAIELATPPVSIYNLKRRDLTTGTETVVVSTVGALASDPAYNTFWPTNTKWFVDAIGFSCVPSFITPKNNIQIQLLKSKTKSNQSNDKQFPLSIANQNYASNNVKVYPNPAKESLSIDVDIFNKENVNVEIQNMFGQVVYQTTIVNQHTVINTSVIADGIYMVNIKHNDKVVAIKKVVINN